MARKRLAANSADADPSEPYERYETEKLFLDVENPRLVELGLHSDAPQFDIQKALWDKMAVAELAMSIAYNGYFPHEPLFLEKRDDEDGLSSKGIDE